MPIQCDSSPLVSLYEQVIRDADADVDTFLEMLLRRIAKDAIQEINSSMGRIRMGNVEASDLPITDYAFHLSNYVRAKLTARKIAIRITDAAWGGDRDNDSALSALRHWNTIAKNCRTAAMDSIGEINRRHEAKSLLA